MAVNGHMLFIISPSFTYSVWQRWHIKPPWGGTLTGYVPLTEVWHISRICSTCWNGDQINSEKQADTIHRSRSLKGAALKTLMRSSAKHLIHHFSSLRQRNFHQSLWKSCKNEIPVKGPGVFLWRGWFTSVDNVLTSKPDPLVHERCAKQPWKWYDDVHVGTVGHPPPNWTLLEYLLDHPIFLFVLRIFRAAIYPLWRLTYDNLN